MVPRPVRRCLIPTQQASRTKDQRSGTHARHPRRLCADAAYPRHSLIIIHHIGHANAAGDAEDVGLWHVSKSGSRHNREASVSHHWIARFPHQIECSTRHPRQELRRASHVELSKAGEEQEGDVHGDGSKKGIVVHTGKAACD